MAHQFELIGGDPALDFVNTIHDWTVPDPRDHLSGFSDALRFGEQAGVLSPPEVRALVDERDPSELERLRALRATLQRVFRATADGRAPARGDLDDLARQAAAAARTARLRVFRGSVVRSLELDAAGAALLRYRLVEAALALLTSPRLPRLKSCPSCGWFFLDTSKNGTRRWCSMRTCGAAAKARSYYWRTRTRTRTPRASGRQLSRQGASTGLDRAKGATSRNKGRRGGL